MQYYMKQSTVYLSSIEIVDCYHWYPTVGSKKKGGEETRETDRTTDPRIVNLYNQLSFWFDSHNQSSFFYFYRRPRRGRERNRRRQQRRKRRKTGGGYQMEHNETFLLGIGVRCVLHCEDDERNKWFLQELTLHRLVKLIK